MNGKVHAIGTLKRKIHDQVLRLANQNADRPDQVQGLMNLLEDPQFIAAPESEQQAQLKAFRRSDPNFIL